MQLMQQPRTFRLLALLLAAFVVAGCSSTSTEPAEEPEEIEQPAPVSPPPTETVERGDFAEGGDGYVPIDSSGRPISLTYYFEYDKAVLAQSDLRSLQLHAGILRRNPDRSVVIEGHCDERGTREYNLALGERRANAAKAYLVALGVDANRLNTISYGKERPEALGSNESAWAQNRRSVTVVQ